MIQLTTCCGCCSVRIGSVLVAVFEIISGLYFILEGINRLNHQFKSIIEWSLIFYIFVLIIFNSLQIYGAVEEMKNFMLPSIILRFIILGLYVILMIIGFFTNNIVLSITKFNYHHEPIPEHVITKVRIGLGVLLLLAITLGTYFSLIPLSYYNKLKSEGKQPQIEFENINSPSSKDIS